MNELTIIPPQELMRQATDVAGVCCEVVERTAIEIGGKKHIPIEGWQTIAIAHNCFTWGGEPRFVEINGVQGFEADGMARLPDGSIITAKGAGFVGSDEVDRNGSATWGSRPIYAQRAMAQTRAASRVSRSLFAHVVMLMNKGLSTTPAEEVPADGFKEQTHKSMPSKTGGIRQESEDKWLDASIVDCRAQEFTYQNGKKKGQKGEFYIIKTEDGRSANTFDIKLRDQAISLGQNAGNKCNLLVKPGYKENSWELVLIEEDYIPT